MTRHQQARQDLWTAVLVSRASATQNTDTPVAWADRALAAFDERFPEPQGDVNPNSEVNTFMGECVYTPKTTAP